MTVFCDIRNLRSLTETVKAYRVKKTSDSGHTRVRPFGRAPKKVWTLGWHFMSTEDKHTLQSFFDDNQAAEFTWTHPATSVEYTVYFVSDEISYEYVHVGRWKVSFKIGEV